MPDVFLDTDVSFDILSKREPHYSSSIKLLELSAKGTIQLMISESSLANLYYLCFDIYKIKNAQSILNDFISACEIAQAGKDSYFYHYTLHLEIKKMRFSIILPYGLEQTILLPATKRTISTVWYRSRFTRQQSSSDSLSSKNQSYYTKPQSHVSAKS